VKFNVALKLRLLVILVLMLAMVFILDRIGANGLQAGTTYYVALTGNDANPGTLAKPFRTIPQGLSVLLPGDTLLVRAGTYTQELFYYNFPSGTSWSAPVTLKAYPGESVILKPGSGADRIMTFRNGSQYIIVDGFILDAINVASDAVKMQYEPTLPGSPNHIRLINCEIKNAISQGILTGTNSDYLEFINLNVHDNGINRFDHGIYILGHFNLIEGGRYYHNASHGIQCDSGPCENNIVRGVLAYNNGVHDPDGRGIGFYGGKNNLFYNNITWDNPDGGIKVWGNDNAKIYNNTIYHNTDYGIWVDQGSTNTIVRNNIVYQTGNGVDIGDDGSGTIQDHNLTNVDPLFVNAAAHDFHLKAGSPAIDAGVALSDVPSDISGKVRPVGAAYDLGAYEYGNVVPTPTTTPSPTPVGDQTVSVAETMVQKVGKWTWQGTSKSFVGGYMYSSGDTNDSLVLNFQQPNVDVYYLENPAFGAFDVIIDDDIVQRVSATASRSIFDTHIAVRNLSPTMHTLKIVPIAGIIAIEGFMLSLTASDPTATQPNIAIPVGGTSLPPTMTDEPTATPPTVISKPVRVVELPFAENFTVADNWQPAGGWQLSDISAHSGKSWFASFTSPGPANILQSSVRINLRSARNPQLQFWQKGSLSGTGRVFVALNLDNTNTWQIIDQQTNLSSDWQPHVLDLTAYRNQVIQLQFIFDDPQADNSSGLWISDLTIADKLPEPTVTPTTTPTITLLPHIPVTATSVKAEDTSTPTLTITPIFTASPTSTDTLTVTPVASEAK
jgi:hypothetical protein